MNPRGTFVFTVLMPGCARILYTGILLSAALRFDSALAENIRTNNGTEYKDVTISRAEPDGLVIIASYGIIKIPFTELSKELQAKYHFDPAAAADFKSRTEAATAAARGETDAAKEARRQEFVRAEQQHQADEQGKKKSAAAKQTYNNPLDNNGTGGYRLAVRAQDIIDAYVANEVDGDQRYKGKTANIGGTVQRVGKDDEGNPYVELASLRGDVICRFDKSLADTVSALRPGNPIGVVGLIKGFDSGIVIVDHCSLP